MSKQPFEITIDDIAHGGSGLGRRGRKTVFVPFTIPGETVLARPLREEDGFITAEGVTLIEASADRVYPTCAAFGFGGCVRCTWQHIALPAQHLLKQDIVADQLERVGGIRNPTVRPVIVAPDDWGYLWSVTYTPDGGKLALPGRAGHAAVVVDDCALIHPDLLDLYDALDLDLTGSSRVRLLRGSDGGRMLILYLTTEDVPELEADLPASVNVILPDNEPMNLIGDSHIRCTIGGRTLRVTAGSALRANVPGIERLAAAVLAGLELTGSTTLLDLYAGVGVFSALAADQCARVTLVESYPPAVTDADDNLAAFDHVDVIEGGVEAVLEALDEPYDAAIVDPPAGLSLAVIDGLAAAQVRRLVYVSDDAAVLAKDGKRLTRAGYQLRFAQPVDLAPHTPFVETVAVFEKAK